MTLMTSYVHHDLQEGLWPWLHPRGHWPLTAVTSRMPLIAVHTDERWLPPSWYLHLCSCENGWRYQGHSLNVGWNLNTHPCPPSQTSFTSIFIPAPNQHKQMEYMRNSTINKDFTTCAMPLYILFCHWNVSPRVILLRNDKHGKHPCIQKVRGEEGRAGGDNLNVKPVGRIKDTVGTWRRMKSDVIGYAT
jgi:hypothetical protein